MTKPTNFQVSEEMRALLEKGVTQAREGFDKVMNVANEAMTSLEDKTGAAKEKATEMRRKNLAFTESSVAAAFDLAQKLVAAKSLDEVMKLQSEYMASQFASVRSHVQEAGQEIQRQGRAVAEELAAEAAKVQANAREAVEKGVEAVKSATRPKK